MKSNPHAAAVLAASRLAENANRLPTPLCWWAPISLSNNTSVKKSYGYKSTLILPGTSCRSPLPKKKRRQQALSCLSISNAVRGIPFKSQTYLKD